MHLCFHQAPKQSGTFLFSEETKLNKLHKIFWNTLGFSGPLLPLSQLQMGPIGTHLSLSQCNRDIQDREAARAQSLPGAGLGIFIGTMAE